MQVIAETNQGYIHSGVPLRCVLHCALLSEVSLHTPRQMATVDPMTTLQVPDGLSAADTLKQFQQSRASVAGVRRLLSNTPLDGVTKYRWQVG